ncbi:chitinase-3-like protein 1 [Xyrichtys novacula]|nr:chitinase-3-like protein 1 [Xyrichtys novacula]
MTLSLAAGLCLIFASLASSTSRLVCYFNSEAERRPAMGKMTVSEIDPNQCTHLVLAFHGIRENEIAAMNETDIQQYSDFNGLKTRNPLLKTLVAVGGPNVNPQEFSSVMNSMENERAFILSVGRLLRLNNFDGVVIDWRYPGGQPQDKTQFTKLCNDLNQAFMIEASAVELDKLLVVASVSADRETIDNGYEVEEIAKSLDFINVLTFDFHGPWESTTGHHSPLFQGSQDTGDKIHSNTDSALKYWQAKGAPAEKLNMGLAAYGRAFSLSSDSTDVGAPASGPAEEGCYTGEEGLWAFYETCLYLEEGTVKGIPDQKVPYGVAEGQWVGYDDENSLDDKVDYLEANNFGGVVVMYLDFDDFTGQFCKRGKSPFISKLHDRIVTGSSQLPSTSTTQPATTTSPPTTKATTTKTTTTSPPTTKATTTKTTTTSPPTTAKTTTTSPPTTKATTTKTTTTSPPTTKATTTKTTTTSPPTTKATTTKTTTTSPPTTAKTTTTSPPTTKTTIKTKSNGEICGSGESGIYPDPDSNTHFYNCDHGSATRQECSSGLVFKEPCKCCDNP